jgi:DNA polymerase/3'-5' exonuclease PolX
MSQKKEIPLSVAKEIAEDFLQKTKDLCRRIEIAGSIRRKEPTVHDIDFAVIPLDSDFAAWKMKLTERIDSFGGKILSFGETITDFIYKDVQINFFLCPDEDSWGITLMWATGPKGHTIGMNIKAKKEGLLVNSRGIFTRDSPPKRIPVPTEYDVGRVLGWRYKPPELRGKEEKRNDKNFYG